MNHRTRKMLGVVRDELRGRQDQAAVIDYIMGEFVFARWQSMDWVRVVVRLHLRALALQG